MWIDLNPIAGTATAGSHTQLKQKKNKGADRFSMACLVLSGGRVNQSKQGGGDSADTLCFATLFAVISFLICFLPTIPCETGCVLLIITQVCTSANALIFTGPARHLRRCGKKNTREHIHMPFGKNAITFPTPLPPRTSTPYNNNTKRH
jgi:hypothetical protein